MNSKKYEKNFTYDETEKGELYVDWYELERDIKDFIEGASIENIENNEMYPFNFSLFQEIFDEDIKISDLVEEYNKNVIDSYLKLFIISKRRWIIEFPYKIVYYYMKIQANTICNIINDICSKKKVKALIIVGIYSKNEVMINLIEKGLNIPIYILSSHCSSLPLMDGTVLFGLESLINYS